MHWILAIVNSCNGLTYVTRFSCDTFGFYVAFIYLQKGIQVLTRQWETGEPAAYLSIVVALLVLMVAYICGAIGGSSLFQRYVRKFIEDYGTPLTLIFFTGFVHIGRMSTIEVQTLPTSRAFFPTQDRGWFVHFWDIDVADVFIAIPFAILLTILFWFDHNGEWFRTGCLISECDQELTGLQSLHSLHRVLNSLCASLLDFIGTFFYWV